MLPKAEQVTLVADMCLASLVGERTFDFGKMVSLPILAVLEGTQYQWMVGLMNAFNDGDIKKYRELAEQKNANQDILVKNRPVLNQKICIMSLVSMITKRDFEVRLAHKADFSFEEIAAGCDLTVNEVELLVIKAISMNVSLPAIETRVYEQ